jgi:hypothetical protein
MARYAIEADEQMLPNIWHRRRSLGHRGIIITGIRVASSLLPSGWMDVVSAMVT